ncbi:MAG TPA: chemotaxis protein CheW [Bryobacteraceae bacterium]|jgi:chemotaxis signal transduction protein|nr:chemotaxis protein CheW [Bryobacteraceae bacterium]
METMVATAANAASPKVDYRAGKYLSFQLGNEEFAVQVLRVRGIMGIQEITAVPQTPDYVKGVINLRGKVIPVVVCGSSSVCRRSTTRSAPASSWRRLTTGGPSY